MMFKWIFNCQEINRMISVGMDTELPLMQRMLIRLHLMMCRSCTQVRAQLISLNAYGRFLGSDEAALDNLLPLAPESRRRMKTRLRQARAEMPESVADI